MSDYVGVVVVIKDNHHNLFFYDCSFDFDSELRVFKIFDSDNKLIFVVSISCLESIGFIKK